MMLHELLKQVSRTLSPEYQQELYDYFLHSMDDNGGFLRTRWCRWEKILPDHKVPDDIKKLVLILRDPFDFHCSKDYYIFEEGSFENNVLTKLKLQLFYYDVSDKDVLKDAVEWSRQLRYDIPIVIDVAEAERS